MGCGGEILRLRSNPYFKGGIVHTEVLVHTCVSVPAPVHLSVCVCVRARLPVGHAQCDCIRVSVSGLVCGTASVDGYIKA